MLQRLVNVVGRIGWGDDDEKLVAAESTDECGLSGGVDESVRDRLEYLIAGIVSELVVHKFEVVEIEDHRRQFARRTGPDESFLQFLAHRRPIQRAGELIGSCQVPEGFDVTCHPDGSGKEQQRAQSTDDRCDDRIPSAFGANDLEEVVLWCLDDE